MAAWLVGPALCDRNDPLTPDPPAGEKAPGLNVLHEREEDGTTEHDVVPFNPHAAYSLSQQRARLPVFKHREQILHLVEEFQTLIVVGETGSGKTTQIPQYLLEAGWAASGYKIAVLQPRRIAAISVAKRIAEEAHVRLGAEVGYAIRFEQCASPSLTRILCMTEGSLLSEMLRDPLLSQYSVIMLDEGKTVWDVPWDIHSVSLHHDPPRPISLSP